MWFLVVAAIVLWFVFGDPATNVASWFWSSSAAPWEEVDAVYYPNRNNLTVHGRRDVGSVENCRAWVRAEAVRRNDSGLKRGDYECGVGRLGTLGSIDVYRLTVR